MRLDRNAIALGAVAVVIVSPVVVCTALFATATGPVYLEPSSVSSHYVEAPTVEVCVEDEPCWDCSTMGNRVCGPVRIEYRLDTDGNVYGDYYR